MAATDIWYFARNGERNGPVSELDLINTIARGDVRAEDLVWKEGMAQWAPAGSVPELFPQGVPAPMQAQGEPVATMAAPAPAQVGHIPYAGGGPLPVSTAAPLDYYTQSGVAYAGFWQRVLGHIIDMLIVGAPFCLIQVFLQAAVGSPASGGPGGPGAAAPAQAASVVLACGMPLVEIVAFWLYYALQESSSHQATLGKRAMGLFVTDTFGRRITFGRASGRYFASILSGMTIGIGYIMAAFTERKQTLHDMIAETLVMRRF